MAAVAAAKLLQSCPTLFDPTDGSPPGSPVLAMCKSPAKKMDRTLLWREKGSWECYS